MKNSNIARRSGTFVFLFSAVLSVALLGQQASAQTETASVSGRVTDQSEAVVPDAQVEIKNTETGAVTHSKTNNDGIYVVPSLKPGSYLVNVNKEGFRSVSVTGLTLSVQDNLVRNFVLQVGSSSESVTVTAESVSIQTGDSQLGTVVSEKAVVDLPLNGRNFTQLLTLTPGATPISTSQGGNLGTDDGSTVALPGSSYSNPSIHGQWNRSTVYLLDGVINTDFRTTTYTILPIVDTIQEFKVQSHNDSAEFGTVLGGIVNLVSKSGANSYHGSAWEFLRNDFFDARGFGDKSSTHPGAFRQNEFGGAMGGPISIPKLYNGKNKTFFYFGYEGWRYRRAALGRYRVPTATELSGDFNPADNALPEQVIYDPATTTSVGGVITRTPFPNNIIPTNRIDPAVQAYLQTYYDKPNLTGDPNGNNVLLTNSTKNDSNSYTVKIDQRVSDHDSGWFRYSRMNVTQANPVTFQVTSLQTMHAKNIGAGWVHSFGPSVLLDVQGGYASRPFVFASPPKAGTAPMAAEGFTGLSAYGPLALNLSGFRFGGVGIVSPALRGNPNYSISTNLSWIRGAHAFRTGFQWVDQRRTQSGNGQHFDFSTVQTADPNNTGNTGLSVASALLGLPADGGFALNNVIDYSIASWGGYFQDTWKAKPKVTLNLGLRYDHINQPRLSKGLQTSIDNNTGTYLIGGKVLPPSCDVKMAAPCIPDNVPFSEHIKLDPNPIHGPNPVWDNVGPRFGIAWAATDKIAVRAGYGLIFDTMTGQSQSFSNSMNSWPANGQYSPSFNGAGAAPVTVQTAQTAILSPLPGPSPWGNATWYEDANHKNAYSHQWNLEIQRQMTSNLVMSVGYVGSKTKRNDLTGLANTAQPGPPGTNAQIQARTPFPWYNGQYFYQTDRGKANYNAFEFKAQRRFVSGFSYLVSYTWSKSIDNGASGWFDSEGGAGQSPLQDYYHPENSRSVSGYDIPHFLSISGTWEPPIGKGKRFLSSGVASYILGNWQINTVTQLRSGQPFNLGVNGDVANVGPGIPWFNYARPNLVGNPHVASPNRNEWFNPAAFAIPVNSFGNFGRNTLRSAHVYNVDLSVFKRFPLGETNAFELRGEAFNALNIQNLGIPGTTLQDKSNFGVITSSAPGTAPRELQLALKFIF